MCRAPHPDGFAALPVGYARSCRSDACVTSAPLREVILTMTRRARTERPGHGRQARADTENFPAHASKSRGPSVSVFCHRDVRISSRHVDSHPARSIRCVRERAMPLDDAETAQPSPETLAYATSRARTAAFIAASGIATYLAFVTVTRTVFLFDVGAVAPIFVAMIGLNLALAATAGVWATWRWTIYGYELFQVAVCTLILY